MRHRSPLDLLFIQHKYPITCVSRQLQVDEYVVKNVNTDLFNKKILKPNFSCSIWNVLKVTSYWMIKMRKYVNTLAIARAQMSFFFFQIVLTLAPCKYWINCSRILLKGYHRIPSSIAGCFSLWPFCLLRPNLRRMQVIIFSLRLQ